MFVVIIKKENNNEKDKNKSVLGNKSNVLNNVRPHSSNNLNWTKERSILGIHKSLE